MKTITSRLTMLVLALSLAVSAVVVVPATAPTESILAAAPAEAHIYRCMAHSAYRPRWLAGGTYRAEGRAYCEPSIFDKLHLQRAKQTVGVQYRNIGGKMWYAASQPTKGSWVGAKDGNMRHYNNFTCKPGTTRDYRTYSTLTVDTATHYSIGGIRIKGPNRIIDRTAYSGIQRIAC